MSNWDDEQTKYAPNIHFQPFNLLSQTLRRLFKLDNFQRKGANSSLLFSS
jgi:hypothetical protein